MQLTYYGHSAFSVIIKGKTILFDPFFTGNPFAKDIDISLLKPDYIFVSHAHGDHIGDTIAIASQTQSKVVSAPEIAGWLSSQGISNTHPINHGGFIDFEFGKVRAVNAIHSSGLPDLSYGGNPFGFIITSSEGNFYFAADTALTMDMQLIPYWTKLDFALLPIGGNFTMDAADAVIAADFIQCNRIIGIHYNTFDLIKIDTNLAVQLFTKKGKELLLPAPGDTLNL